MRHLSVLRLLDLTQLRVPAGDKNWLDLQKQRQEDSLTQRKSFQLLQNAI